MRLMGMVAACVLALAVVGTRSVSAAPRTHEDERKIEALKERMAALEQDFNEEKARWDKAYARMDKDSPRTQDLLAKHKEKMQAMRAEHQELKKRIDVLEAVNSNDLKTDVKVIAALREQIEEIDRKLEDEDDTFYREYSRLPRNSREARELQARHEARTADLRSERYKLMKRIAEAKQDAKEEVEDLRRALTLVDEEVAEENQRHDGKLSMLAARQKRIREQLELIERPRALAANQLRERMADVDKRLAEENAQFNERVTQININKHRIYVALQQPGLSLQQAGELRARMGEQDRILAELKADHAQRLEGLQGYRASLERELDRLDRRHP